MTHVDLVNIARRWLYNTNGCAVVATERADWRSGENPDAIWWLPDGMSILVECKVSREDFVADQRKPHRRIGGMGRQRWYLTPKGLLRGDMIPDGWGLVEYDGRFVRRKVHAPIRDADLAWRRELPLLIAITRRAGSSPGVTVSPEAEQLERADEAYELAPHPAIEAAQ